MAQLLSLISIICLTHSEKTVDKREGCLDGIKPLGKSEEEAAGCSCLLQAWLLEQRHTYMCSDYLQYMSFPVVVYIANGICFQFSKTVSFSYWVYFSIKNIGSICLLLRKLYRIKFVCILLVCDETLHGSSLENELILKDFGHCWYVVKLVPLCFQNLDISSRP